MLHIDSPLGPLTLTIQTTPPAPWTEREDQARPAGTLTVDANSDRVTINHIDHAMSLVIRKAPAWPEWHLVNLYIERIDADGNRIWIDPTDKARSACYQLEQTIADYLAAHPQELAQASAESLHQQADQARARADSLRADADRWSAYAEQIDEPKV
jgi:hypothetical protein